MTSILCTKLLFTTNQLRQLIESNCVARCVSVYIHTLLTQNSCVTHASVTRTCT